MRLTADNECNYLEKVYCNDLITGMYVQELDRPWLETPFMFQGFRIRNNKEIDALKQHCEYVYINKVESEIDTTVINANTIPWRDSESQISEVANRPVNSSKYVDSVTVEEELVTARGVYDKSSSSIANIFVGVHDDDSLNLSEVRKTSSDIVDSVLRNPDAFLLLQNIRNKSQYMYTHAINSCALAATFCRHLGFSKEEIHDISMGALLLDIGTVRLPSSLLEMRSQLNKLSLKLVRHHIKFGIEILENTPNMPSVVHKMVLTHHERVNGKGYPSGLKGDEIPICGRIAAIVDCYDAMIRDRPYRRSMSPTEAVCTMYNWRKVDFHEDLVEQFIQCIGAYPTGSLVRLNSGQTGIVMSQNRTRRLYPKVLLILNADGVQYQTPSMLDLWEYAQKTRGTCLEINRVMDIGELGIDPSEYYL
jgi:HD-GYP domain-containing protein (c-di-GMP phosphodiesterase class II)